MNIKLIFHAELKKYNNDLPKAMIAVPEGSTVGDLVARLNVPMEQIAFAAVNGSRAPFSQVLADGDEVKLFQPVGGG